MSNKDWKHQLTDILGRLSLLEEKYSGLGQDLLAYLDGLYYSNGLNYWEYIHLESLLGLQTPRTPFPDEVIFITYHQMTELMFKLIKLELKALTDEKGEESEHLKLPNWHKRIGRVVNYFKHLCNSFDIMLTGMDREEMRKFRMALLPASGFQSVQFREIEIMSTGLENLIPKEKDEGEKSIADRYPNIYWKAGGIDSDTGKKTITLRTFEAKYDEELIQLIESYEERNVEALFRASTKEIREDEELKELLRNYDVHMNVFWKLSHLSAASRHLVQENTAVEATGGTNWKSFLPPKFQKITFYKDLWSKEEVDDWGKAAVVKHFQKSISSKWMK
ncbi:MAG: tryptophan 2,3-dioxygenase family protein [Bacteroidota bacterium]